MTHHGQAVNSTYWRLLCRNVIPQYIYARLIYCGNTIET